MDCPVCKVPLSMSDRQGVEIDFCPQCRGVWLDRGELDKILERSRGMDRDDDDDRRRQPYPPQGYPQQPYPTSYPQPHYKKKKSWLEDIFD